MDRRLAAIVAADVAGFSRLVGTDEEGTLAELRAHRAELIDPLLAQHNGRVANTAGDSLLIEFPSAVDAVRCAIALQDGMRARSSDVAEDRRIEYRIGVNVGDVVPDGEDLLGEGVNVAARLEGLAPPGGIVLSRSARDQVRDRMELNLADLGEVEAKNITRPVRAFQVLRDGEVPVQPVDPGRRWALWRFAAAAAALLVAAWTWWQWIDPEISPADPANMAFALPDKPSIAVLAFDNLSGDPDQEFVSDGISEDITSALARIPQLFVIARNSAFSYKGMPVKIQRIAEELGVRYVLEGSVQRDGDRLRVTAQLIDAVQGHHLWSERYDRQMADLFDVKDEITARIASSMNVELVRGNTVWGRDDTITNFNAWLLHMQSWEAHDRYTQEDNAKSIELAEKALSLDPNSAKLHSALGWRYYVSVRFGWADQPEQRLSKALDLAEKSQELDPDYAGGHALESGIHLFLSDYETAIAAGTRAVSLAPSDSDMRAILGLAHQKSMHADEAIDDLETSVRLNPHAPLWILENLGEAYVIAGRYEDAIAIYADILERDPKGALAGEVYLGLAVSHDALGDEGEARAQLKKAIEVFPQFTVAYLRDWVLYKDPVYTERWLATLARLGLPEE